MDHIVYLDGKSKEMENLLNGNKSMIIRGGSEKRLPYGKVKEGDVLYFISNPGGEQVEARGRVTSVFNSGELSVEESFETIIKNQDKLQLPDKQFDKIAGKKFLVLIGLSDIQEISPFPLEKNGISASVGWFPVENVEELYLGKVKIA